MSPRRILFAVALLGLLALPACGNDPYCAEFDDITGRAVAFCQNPRTSPVCDAPGDEARFEEGTMGLELVGGEYASCNGDREIQCPAGTEGPAYCILEPEL